MALTQLGQIAMMTTDLALIGRLGDAAIAAVGLAHLILFVGFVLGMGPVSAITPLAAQAFGAREPRMVRRSLRVGLWAALILGIPVNVAQLWGRGHSHYGRAIICHSGPRRPLSDRAGMVDDPGLVLHRSAQLHGRGQSSGTGAVGHHRCHPNKRAARLCTHQCAFGAPRLDLLGAGLATTFVNVAMCAAAIWICYTCRPFKKYRMLGRFWRADWELLRELIAIGLPISGALMLEWGLFSSGALLMGWIGTTALAAHQIALQVAAILFMIPFGISLAATVRVGQALGRRDPIAVRRAGFGAIALGAALMVAMALVVVAFRDLIPLLFLGHDAGGNAAAARLASTLLLIGASFFVTDGVQTIAAGALRGINDTRVPMFFAAVSFWLIGFTCAYGLAFPGGLGAVGIWIGFSSGVATFAALLISRFHALTMSEDGRGRAKGR
jgi:MATE family multidrug resistance protein